MPTTKPSGGVTRRFRVLRTLHVADEPGGRETVYPEGRILTETQLGAGLDLAGEVAAGVLEAVGDESEPKPKPVAVTEKEAIDGEG